MQKGRGSGRRADERKSYSPRERMDGGVISNGKWNARVA